MSSKSHSKSHSSRRFSYRLLEKEEKQSKEKRSLEEALNEERKDAEAPLKHAKRARFAQALFGRLNNIGVPVAGIAAEVSKYFAESLENVSAEYSKLPKDSQNIFTEASKMIMEATEKKSSISSEEFDRLEKLFKELVATVAKYKPRDRASIELKINEIALQINQIVTSLVFEKDLSAGAKRRHIVSKSPSKSPRKSPRKSPKKSKSPERKDW
jgi:hypothetical protein